MTLTTKEQGLLADLKVQEQLCIEKYGKYSNDACDCELKNLFSQLGQNEQKHLNWINQIQSGQVPDITEHSGSQSKACGCGGGAGNCSDAYLCKDALSMEKHVSALYDTSVFEFGNEQLRKVLNKIQSEEQHHGELLFGYMSAHNIYA